MKKSIVLFLILALGAVSALSEEVFLGHGKGSFFRNQRAWSKPFILHCQEGFAQAYKDCPKAEELGWGFCCLPGGDKAYQATWYAYKDAQGLTKIVFYEFFGEADLEKIRNDFVQVQAWKHSEVVSKTKNGEITWDAGHRRYTTLRSDNLNLEQIFEKLEKMGIARYVAKDGEALDVD